MVGKVLAGVLVVSSFAIVTTGAGASTTTLTKSSVARTAPTAHPNSSLDATQFQDPNPQLGDLFGYAVSLSADGNIAVVSAPQYGYNCPDPWSGNCSLEGAAYVFLRSTSGWVLATTLSPSDIAPHDGFGASVSITPTGSQIVVGGLGPNLGKAYIFMEPLNGWDASPSLQQTAELASSDLTIGLLGSHFGMSVSQSDDGETVVVSGKYQDAAGLRVAGEAWLYQAPTAGWRASGSLINDSRALLPSVSHEFGYFGWATAVSADGSRIFVGAPNAQRIYVFDRPTEGWTSSSAILNETVEIANPNSNCNSNGGGSCNDFFGQVIATSPSGDQIMVGAPGTTVGDNSVQGLVYAYHHIDNVWSLTSSLSAPDGGAYDQFGTAIALSSDGQTAFIGSPNHAVLDVITDTRIFKAGAAYSFSNMNDAGWSETQEINSPTPMPYANYGWTLSILSGGDYVIGAPAVSQPPPTANARRGSMQAKSRIAHAISKGTPGAAFARISTLIRARAQQPLTISNSSRIGAVGTSISLSTSGGSGTIAPTFAVTGAGCSISGARLSATLVATCVVTATNPANGNYLVAHSAPVSFHFSSPQSALKISNSKLSGAAGTAVKLTAKGGTGSGSLSFSVSGANCTLSGSSLNATGLAQCVVTATKAASASYGPAVSPTVKFTFALAAQAALKVSNSVKKGTVGTAVKLTASGGSGSGLLSFSVTGSGCAISGQLLTTTKAGNCSVKATKAASGIYAVAVSPAVVFTFTAKK
ncbi:unannotated protein [freshwater metagenome]|uniref:Unannotated protein n=1 Tax=freshwater metagenome TaxID=449393 RepID=A0A6J7E259_9ZZZZ